MGGRLLGQDVLPLTREWIEMEHRQRNDKRKKVLPLTREWIEIIFLSIVIAPNLVLPLTREWIEITARHG